MKKFTEKPEQRPFRMDRCIVNQTFSTAEFHLRPYSKHLDAAFCSDMSKTKTLNQSFIQKDLIKYTVPVKACSKCFSDVWENVATFVYR